MRGWDYIFLVGMAQAMVDQVKEKNGTAFAEELSRQLKEHAMAVEGEVIIDKESGKPIGEKPAPKKRGPPKKAKETPNETQMVQLCGQCPPVEVPKKKDPDFLDFTIIDGIRGPKKSTKKLLEKFPEEEPKKQGTKRKAPAKVNAQEDPDEPPKKKAKLNNSGVKTTRKKQPLTAEERLTALEEEVKRLYALLADYDYDDHEKRIYELEVAKGPKKAKRQNATVSELVNKDLFG